MNPKDRAELDQDFAAAADMLKDTAKLLWLFRRAVINEGFTSEAAMLLTLECAKAILRDSFEVTGEEPC